MYPGTKYIRKCLRHCLRFAYARTGFLLVRLDLRGASAGLRSPEFYLRQILKRVAFLNMITQVLSVAHVSFLDNISGKPIVKHITLFHRKWAKKNSVSTVILITGMIMISQWKQWDCNHYLNIMIMLINVGIPMFTHYKIMV